MKITTIIIFAICFFTTEKAFSFGGLNLGSFWQNPEQPVFTQQLGQSPNSPSTTTQVYGSTIDSSGNLYITGNTSGNLVSCNGVLVNCTGASQGTVDYFVAKYNSSGVWQWTRQLGVASKSSTSYGVAVDSSGNVFLTGFTTGSLSSCNGVSTNCTGASKGFYDMFLVKYDSSGNYQWLQQLGQTSKLIQPRNVGVDTSGNVYIGGQATANLMTCAGVTANCAGTSKGSQDYFISKYDTSGAWQWSMTLGQSSKQFINYGFTIDSGNYVILSGYSSGNAASCAGVAANCSG
ncbi:MAG: SBBP repeat-containing protein, partial [Bdellovibrionales bacterium]|nr:SBBP repeat-containing protein [Bdellovibrionales bacterium]